MLFIWNNQALTFHATFEPKRVPNPALTVSPIQEYKCNIHRNINVKNIIKQAVKSSKKGLLIVLKTKCQTRQKKGMHIELVSNRNQFFVEIKQKIDNRRWSPN